VHVFPGWFWAAISSSGARGCEFFVHHRLLDCGELQPFFVVSSPPSKIEAADDISAIDADIRILVQVREWTLVVLTKILG
jgi:hypothetical protein